MATSLLLVERRWGTAPLLLLCLVGCGAVSWKPVALEDPGIRVSFPAPPEETTERLETAAGLVTAHWLTAVVPPSFVGVQASSYSVQHYPIPDTSGGPNATAVLLDDSAKRLIRSAQEGVHRASVRVIETNPLSFEGAEGRELVLAVDNASSVIVIQCAYVFHGRHFFALQAVVPPSKRSDGTVRQFFDSLSLMKGMPAP